MPRPYPRYRGNYEIVILAVAGQDSVSLVDIFLIVADGESPQIGHDASCLAQDSFGRTDVPLFRHAASVDVDISLLLADEPYLKACAPVPEVLADAQSLLYGHYLGAEMRPTGYQTHSGRFGDV